jgi:predicted molibdopterin-dependent oxidoreductase YjgC
MGSRLWSNTTNLIGGHKFELAEDREIIASKLSIPLENIPTITGWSYDRIMDGIRQGKIKALWVIATNPAHSWIDQAEARKSLDSLDFLVVQDMYDSTETAQRADLVLPAAAWGEKEGTFINSERRYGLLKKVRKAPGEALSDFSIFKALAHYWGVEEMFAQWKDPESVFRILQGLSRGMPHDITGIDGYQQIDRCGGIQWPWTQADAASKSDPDQQRRLFADGVFPHANGRAKLIVDDVTPPPETPCSDYPIWLLSGRGTVSQWHTQTRTSKSPILRKLYPNRPYVEIHPDDAQEIGVVNGQEVIVRSRRGEAIANAMIVPTVAAGQAFMPMHYEATNQLTLSHFDPHSRQPSYKDCAVKIEPTQIKRK